MRPGDTKWNNMVNLRWSPFVGLVSTLLTAASLASACSPLTKPRLQEGPLSDRFGGSSNIQTRAAAIERVLQVHPELRGFTSRALPPASIETKAAPLDGWFVGFLHRGSGRPGVIDAKCFIVDSSGRVSSAGEFAARPTSVAEQIDLSNCQ